MSLFSGMKISGAVGDEDQKDASSSKHDKISPQGSASAFGFLTKTTDNSSSKEQTSKSETPQSQFGFIRSSINEGSSTAIDQDPSPHSQPDTNTRMDFDVDLDLDLDLDFELDPLRPKSRQGQDLRGKGGTDLEGIDFSSDLDLNILKEDSRKSKRSIARGQPLHNVQNEEDLSNDRVFKQHGNIEILDGENKDIKKTLHEQETCMTDTCKLQEQRESKFGFISESSLAGSISEQDTVLSSDHQTDIAEGEVHTDPIHAKDDTCLDTEAKTTGENMATSSSLYDLELDVGEMFEVLQEAHAAAEQQMRSAQEALETQLMAAGRQHLQALHTQIRRQQRLGELQASQAKAVAEENYEEAEVLTEQCTSLEVDLRRIPSVMLGHGDDDAIQDILRSSQELGAKAEQQETEWERSYRDLLQQQEGVVSRMRGEGAGETEGERQRINAQRAELDRALGHVLLDKTHVIKRESQLLMRIDEKTADLRSDKDQLQEQKMTIQDEIATLELQLAKLRSEEASLNAALSRQDEAICAVKAGFREELTIIEEEKEKVEKREERLNEQQAELNSSERALSEWTQHYQAKLEKEETLLSRISSCLQTNHWPNEDSESTHQCTSLTDLSLEMEPSKDIECLREKICDATVEIQSKSALILSNQTSLTTLKKKVMETEDDIAELQGAKQLAVSTKSFGEAKRIAGEIKARMVEGQAYQAEVETRSDELRRDKGSLEALQEQVCSLQVELAEAEKTWELGVLDRAKEMVTSITTRLESRNIEDTTTTTTTRPLDTLHAHTLGMERQACALLVCWLSDRHHLPRPEGVQPIVQQAEEGLAAAAGGADLQEGEEILSQIQVQRSSPLSDAVKAELAELEERLEKAVEEEDYDSAELIQARIEHLKHQATDT